MSITPQSPPHPTVAQPVYNYYKNPISHEYVDSYQNVHQYQQHPPTSATFYSNTAVPQPQQQYNNHINVDNIKIDTYNTAPFHNLAANVVSSVAAPAGRLSIIGPTHESVFPTSSTPAYRNVYILPSPRTNNNAYSTSEPSYVNSSPNYDYFVDYEYKTTHPTTKAASNLNTNALFYKS